MSQVKTLDGLSRQTGNLDSLLSLFHSVFYQQQEQFVLQRSARLNLDPGADVTNQDRSDILSFARSRSLRMIICKRPVPPDDQQQQQQ